MHPPEHGPAPMPQGASVAHSSLSALLRPCHCVVPRGIAPSRDSWITWLQTTTPCKHLGGWGGAERGFFLFFVFLFPCFFKMATSSSILNARSRLQPPRRPPGTAALLCQKCRPSGYCYLRKHLQMFQGWDLRLAGNACPVAFLHGFPLLQRKQQMILMDHSG